MHDTPPWASGLSEEEFERTLLVVGLLPSRMARRQTLPVVDELRRLLVTRWQALRGRPWAWSRREGTERLIWGRDEAVRLIQSAEELLARTRDDWNMNGRGLRVEVNFEDPLGPHDLSMVLQRAGAHSIYWRRTAEGEMTWAWPLRIGINSASELLTDLTPDHPLRPLVHVFHYERAPVRANLLLLEASLSEATGTIVRSGRRPSSDAVIAFGGLEDAEGSVWEKLSFLSELTGAQAAVVFDRLEPRWMKGVTEGLIAHLSHDLPLDSAVGRIAREHGVSVFASATRTLLEATSVRKQGRMLARQLQEMRGARIRLDASTVRDLGGGDAAASVRVGRPLVFGSPDSTASGIWVRAGELGAALEERIQPPREGGASGLGGPAPLRFDRESQGARTLAALAKAAALEREVDAAYAQRRHLQARVETEIGHPVQGKAPLLRSRRYFACVFIGARDQTWLGLDQPLEAPDPPDGSHLILNVLFWEPTVSPEPQIARLELRTWGDTEVVRFPFRTAADQSVFSARIAVYHRNRNLQTGLLSGRIGEGPAALMFTPDAAPFPQFVGLEDRVGVGASIIVNDDHYGNKRAFVYQDGKASVADVPDERGTLSTDVDPSQAGGLAGLTAALGRAITRITTNPEEYSDLAKEGSRMLLVELAQHGCALLTRLRKHTHMRDAFDQVDYIQIVAAHVDAFFPVEFLYDGEAPEDDARICNSTKAAADALASGTCCGSYACDPVHTICPLRFWSLSKVIERHAHLPEHADLPGEFRLRTAPISARTRILDPLRGAVVAASKEADTAVPGTVERLRRDLDEVLRNKPASLASDWRSWEEKIADARPSMLVLLPHHVQANGFDLLEIGGDKRKSMQIRSGHVRSPQDPNARPIVLLIGCQTNAAKVDLEGFVPAFQDAGARIIVSTIASILGRQAGPAASAIAQELKKQEGNPDATFGEVMLAVRRRLLAEGSPMVLGLTSYGDADWRIGTAAEDDL